MDADAKEQDVDLSQLRATLYALWRVRGVRYRIVQVEDAENCED